ncbi:MAG: PhzF family phenazine biosynthesis protein [Immundisolibacter sp.]|uniref:PhzF family phenazine biosynthesis protein n=1 Tax=Immundisolibacter sp. TaxID=1934948 RepID=UPI003EDF167B
MELSFYTADVFTERPFGGAQIAVFPAAAGLDPGQMQRIAAELNLPNSVFVVATEMPDRFRVRIFTPRGEVDFAGQAVLAAAHILALSGQAPGGGALELLHNFGPVQVRPEAAQGRVGFVQFSHTVYPVIDRFVPAVDELAGILSLERRLLGERDLQPLLVACERPYLILPLGSLNAVTQARFNAAAWAGSHAPSMLAQELLLFCRQTESPQANFHARLVGPDIGPHDDPPVGAALPAFAAYLSAQSGLRSGTHTFTVERGFDATRKSLLQAEFDKYDQGGLKLRMGGHAVQVIQGTLSLPD